MATPSVYDTLCSIGELFDKLSIENIKCYDANNRIVEERKRDNPRVAIIADLEFKARSSGEQRCRLKQEINVRIHEAVQRGGIQVAPEVRTYQL